MERIELFPEILDTFRIGTHVPASPGVPIVDRRWTPSGRAKKVISLGPACDLCPRHRQRLAGEVPSKPVMLRGTGPGRMLVVSSGQAAYAPQVEKLVRIVRRQGYAGDILLDFAVRCGDPKKPPTDSEIDECARYLAHSFYMYNPDMVLVCGSRAAKALSGYNMSPHTNRLCWFSIPGLHKRVPVVGTHKLNTIDTNEMCFRQAGRDVAYLLHLSRQDIKLPEVHGVVVYDAAELQKLEPWFESVAELAFDVETYGIHHQDDFEITLVTLAKDEWSDVIVITYHALQQLKTWAWLKEKLTLPHVAYGGQNVIFDVKSFLLDPRAGWAPGPIKWDTMVDQKMMYAESAAALDQLAYLVGVPSPKAEMSAAQKDIKKQKHADLTNDLRGAPTAVKLKNIKAYLYKDVPAHIIHRYGARDSWVTIAVRNKQKVDLEKFAPVKKHRERLIYDAYGMYTRMSMVGVYLNQRGISQAEEYFQGQIDEHEKVLRRHGIEPTRLNTIVEYILDVFPPDALKYTDKGAVSTDRTAMKYLKARGDNEVLAHLEKWRAVMKRLSSYVKVLPTYLGKDGRVHPVADITGARSGRISMKNPAAQTIPSRGKEAKVVKNLFQADGTTWGSDAFDDDWVIIQGDFKTLEIYIAALWSMDPKMLEILAGGADYHAHTAARIAPFVWNVTTEEAHKIIAQQKAETGESPWRSMAKTTNFAIIYQTGPRTLAENTGMSVSVATDMITSVRQEFQGLTDCMNNAKSFAQRTGEIWVPWFGEPARRRELPAIGANDWRKGNPERASQNTPIQGWASDICMASAVKIEQELINQKLPARLILSVHDSLLVECKSKYKYEVREVMQRCMTDWPTGPLKLAVDFEVGETWGNLHSM